MNNEISTAIEKAVREQTFTPDALKLFTDTIDKVKKLEDQLSGKTGDLVRQTEKTREAAAEAQRNNSELQTALETIEAMKRRENGVIHAEKSVAAAQAELSGYTNAMETVFKVPQVRREFHKSVHENQDSHNDAQGNYRSPTRSETVDENTTEIEE